MALASGGVITPFFKSASSNAAAFTALMDAAGLGAGLGVGAGVVAAVPVSAPVATGAFSFAALPFLFCAKTGTTTMARTTRPDNRTFIFRIDNLTLNSRIDGVFLAPA
jgi:hypothetical protein